MPAGQSAIVKSSATVRFGVQVSTACPFSKRVRVTCCVPKSAQVAKMVSRPTESIAPMGALVVKSLAVIVSDTLSRFRVTDRSTQLNATMSEELDSVKLPVLVLKPPT